MGDSARFRGCAAELNVFLEKKVEELEARLNLSDSMYKVAIRERDYERDMVNLLAASLREMLDLTAGQQIYSFMDPARKRAELTLHHLK